MRSVTKKVQAVLTETLSVTVVSITILKRELTTSERDTMIRR